MSEIVGIFMSGCCGRMGRAINEMVINSDGAEIVAGCDLSDNIGGLDFPVFKNIDDCNVDFDCIIDFSNVSAFDSVLNFALKLKKPLVMCTTGLTEDNLKALEDASKIIPVFKSANMSIGMNVMIELCKKASKFLYPGYDIEIVEAHHNKKLDAPSGTALMLADAIKDEVKSNTDVDMNYVFERQSVRKQRSVDEIGISSIRGGNIVGEHDVMFIGGEEVLTVSHSAQTRAVFARGAVSAALFVKGKEPGYYSMSDMINF